MKNKKNKKISLLKRLFNQYRIVVINEETFEDKFYFRFSRISIFLTFLISVICISSLTYLSIIYSPIKEFIPGYPSSKMRIEAISNAIKIDSITLKIEKQKRYFQSIQSALIGENNTEELPAIKTDYYPPKNTSTFFKPSIEDSLLRAAVAREDKYNVVSDNNETPLFTLYTPVKGIVTEKFDFNNKHFAVDIAVIKNFPIKSVAEGTVVFSEWTAETGYVIIIEHPFDLLSVYKHNASLTKQQGDIIEAGEVIAMAGNTGKFSTGYHLHFELWTDGYPLDPEKFMDFSN